MAAEPAAAYQDRPMPRQGRARSRRSSERSAAAALPTERAAAASTIAAANSPASWTSFTTLRAGSIAHSADSPPHNSSSPKIASGTRSAPNLAAASVPAASDRRIGRDHPGRAQSGDGDERRRAARHQRQHHRQQQQANSQAASHADPQAGLAPWRGSATWGSEEEPGAGAASGASPPSARFDLAGWLTIVLPLSQERGRLAPASARLHASMRRAALLGQQQSPRSTLFPSGREGRGQAKADSADMSKREESKYKINRRLGVNLWGRAKSPLNRREYGPGQHGQRRKKPSDYGTQLSAKQKLKGYYANIGERQFRRLYEEAVRRRGDTGENLIELLERRLDATVYRMKLVADAVRRAPAGQSRPCAGQRQARQHPVLPAARRRHDRAETARQGDGRWCSRRAGRASATCPDYVEIDHDRMRGRFVRAPKLADVPVSGDDGAEPRHRILLALSCSGSAAGRAGAGAPRRRFRSVPARGSGFRLVPLRRDDFVSGASRC